MLLKVCFFLSCFLHYVRLARCRRGSQFMMIEFLFSLLRPNPKCNIFSGRINKVFVLVLLSESDIHEEKSRQYIYPIRYSGHMRSRGEASLLECIFIHVSVCLSLSRDLVFRPLKTRRQLLSCRSFFRSLKLRAVFAK